MLDRIFYNRVGSQPQPQPQPLIAGSPVGSVECMREG